MDDERFVTTPADSGGSPAFTAEVLHDGQIGADDEHLLLTVLAACGVTARVKVIPPRRDAQALTWLVLISLPLQGFLSMVGGKLAEDAYGRFTRAVGRLLDHHRRAEDATATQPVLVLDDPATGLRIILESDLPREAHEQLVALDLSGYRFGPLRYDRTLHRWRSEMDEMDTGHAPS
jgi:hypothetical protein